MNPFFIYFFQTHSHQIIMEHQLANTQHEKPNQQKIVNKKDLTVRIDMTDNEVDQCFQKGIKECEYEIKEGCLNYYKVYLKHLYSEDSDYKVERAMNILKDMRETVDFQLLVNSIMDQYLVRRLLDKNEYISKNTKKPGLTVKLFKAEHSGRQVIVKTYLYDPKCKSLAYSVEFNFKNEAVFQLYTNRVHYQKKFISPELYTWGYIDKHIFEKGGYNYKCLFMIMEYIPHLTLKESSFIPEKMKTIYERVSKIDEDLKSNLMHHNDLHGGNILVSSPLPEIVILDFGEASFGPRRPLYMSGIKM